MKNIIIIAEEFYPINTTTAINITTIAENLSKHFNVKIICNTSLNKKKELAWIKDIKRIKELNISKYNLISRLLRLVISSTKLSYFTLKYIQKDSHIFTMTNPIFIVLFLAIIKKFKKLKYTLLVYDVFPDNLVSIGILKKKSFLYKLLEKIFNWSYSQADNLIVIGRDMEEILNEKTISNNELNIHFIPNWCNVNKIYPLEKKNNSIIKKLSLEDKIVFAFIGNLGRVQGIDNLLMASKLVTNKKFALLFIGDGIKKNAILKAIKDNDTNNVYYAGSYPLSEQNLILNSCDISIVSLSNLMYGLGVPSKSYYNMAAAKPILYIGDKYSEIGRVINENKIGWIVEPNNTKLLASTIDEICNDILEINLKGKKSRQTVNEIYSETIIMQQYIKLFKKKIE